MILRNFVDTVMFYWRAMSWKEKVFGLICLVFLALFVLELVWGN